MKTTILELTENELDVLTALAMNTILRSDGASKVVKSEIGDKAMAIYGLHTLSSLMKYESMTGSEHNEIIVSIVNKLFSELNIID